MKKGIKGEAGPAPGFLVGKKVVLRGLEHRDLEAYRSWLDDPEVTRYLEMGWRPTSDEVLEATYKSATQSHDEVVFAIVDKHTRGAVGTCGLYQIHWVSRRAQFNILIGEPSSWNKGFGTEALDLTTAYGFERLNLQVIFLGVNVENKPAIRSYEKAGFVREGVRRRFVYRDGRYYDQLMMSMLREEFEARSTGTK